MRRFTLTLALVTIVAFAFGQRTNKLEQFSNVSPMLDKQYMPTTGEKSTDMNVVWGEYFVDSAAGTNGLPANFTYTPNSSEIKDQWQWESAGGEGRIGRGWYEDKAISETFYTDAHTVPATNPGLYVVFVNSYHWAIEVGTDSLEISYSIDGGSNWVRLWSNRDQALCEASGINWPYPSDWIPITARISLPASTIGSDMEFKFTYEGGTANGIYVYSIEMVEQPDYEVEMQGYIAENYVNIDDTDYFDGLYQLLPIDQKKNFEYFGAALKNFGQKSATKVTLSSKFSADDGTLIAQKDTNYMALGQDITNTFDVDTFECNVGFDNIDATTIGKYVLESNISYDSISYDSDTTNNKWSIGIEYDNALPDGSGAVSHLARNTTITGQLGVHQYNGGAENDMLGMSFYVSEHCIATGAKIPLGSATTNNTGFAARVYAYDNGAKAWTQVTYADDKYTGVADAGTTVDVDFVNQIELYPDTSYMLVCAAKFTAGVSKIYFGTYNDYKDFQNISYMNRYASVLNLGGTWYYIHSVPTMVLTLEATASVNTVDANSNIKVYPNPTNGVLHIDNVAGASVKVYNMLGSMIEVIDNANEFNTINLSNYETGTYLVKVFTKEGVVVEKINVTK